MDPRNAQESSGKKALRIAIDESRKILAVSELNVSAVCRMVTKKHRVKFHTLKNALYRHADGHGDEDGRYLLSVEQEELLVGIFRACSLYHSALDKHQVIAVV